MCGRFTLTLNIDEIEDVFDLDQSMIQWIPSFNIAPSQMVPIFSQNEPGKIKLVKWGIHKTFNPSTPPRFLINIRKETLFDKHSFDSLLKGKRCLIPANGFYEWKRDELKSKSSMPYYFTTKSHSPFAFAGLWDDNNIGTEDDRAEFAIITCAANEIVSQVHSRMPVILDHMEQKMWLSKDGKKDLIELLQPYENRKMECYTVAPQVNNPSYNSLECIRPFSSLKQNSFL